jgi:hypothetical protein
MQNPEGPAWDGLLRLAGPGSRRWSEQLAELPADLELLTFWSLEEAYPGGRLRYHLGQVVMLQVMNRLAEKGQRVRSILCDPDSLTLRGEAFTLWRDNLARTSRFLELVADRSIRTAKMSELIREQRKRPEFQALRTAVASAALRFRDEILQIDITDKAQEELSLYRGYRPDKEPPRSLAPLARALRSAFDLPPYLLLSTAYAFFQRPSWFSSDWLADFCAHLSCRTAQVPGLTLLEADRNAYAWLLMECLFALAGPPAAGAAWPALFLLDSVPAVDGRGSMMLRNPAGCLFLDAPPEELRQRLDQTPAVVRQEINRLFLDGQTAVALDADGWEDEVLLRFAGWQARCRELLRHRPGAAAIPRPSPARAAYDVFFSYNRADFQAVQDIAEQLEARGLHPWIDLFGLRPGMPWQPALECVIDDAPAAAVFIGRSGVGPWQREEIDALLAGIAKDRPVIPVLLPDAPAEPALPAFLRNRTWVDFRRDVPAPLDLLIFGITGQNEEAP